MKTIPITPEKNRDIDTNDSGYDELSKYFPEGAVIRYDLIRRIKPLRELTPKDVPPGFDHDIFANDLDR